MICTKKLDILINKNVTMFNLKDVLNSIILGDCIENMKKIPSESVNLIFADPPYFMQLQGSLYRPDQSKVDAVDDEWDKFDSFKIYDKFTREWLLECNRILKPNGTIWVIGSYHNIFRVGKEIQDIGFWILNDIIWIKSNPMPNFLGTRFNNAHETLIWASKSKNSKYTFHYKSLKAGNNDLQMRSDWYLGICQGEERLKDKNGKKVHTTQKPMELLFRVIMSSTNVGDVILDPFSGTGTTATVAKRLNRSYIGLERDETYYKESIKRLDTVKPIAKELLEYRIEKKEPLVAFTNLIEKGMIKIGQILIDKKNNIGIVNADGTITLKNEFVGSIHKTGAHLQEKESCNGWTYWFLKMPEGEAQSIDLIRKMYRAKYM
jgi:DNA modification methylase